MPAGIEIYNNIGTVQIDDTSPVLGLRQVVSVDMKLQSPSTYYLGVLSLTGYKYPLVAIRCDTACWAQSIHIGSSPFQYSFRTNEPGTVTAYCFDVIQPPFSTSGLVVRNSKGDVMFDAYKKPAIVAGGSDSDLALSVPEGRTYAVAMSVLRHVTRYSIDTEPPRRLITSSRAPAGFTSSTQAKFWAESEYARLAQTSSDPAPRDKVSRADTFGFILDVTGY